MCLEKFPDRGKHIGVISLSAEWIDILTEWEGPFEERVKTVGLWE